MPDPLLDTEEGRKAVERGGLSLFKRHVDPSGEYDGDYERDEWEATFHEALRASGLVEALQQARDERDGADREAEDAILRAEAAEAERDRLRGALEHIANPNYGATATGTDAKLMAQFARAALLDQEAER